MSFSCVHILGNVQHANKKISSSSRALITGSNKDENDPQYHLGIYWQITHTHPHTMMRLRCYSVSPGDRNCEIDIAVWIYVGNRSLLQ